MMDTGGLIRKLSKFIAPLSDYVPGELCRNHSIAYLNGLLNGSTWATRMWDSSAKSQAGLFTGNLNTLGNFDECISIRDVQDVTGNFSGQYCLPTMNLVNKSEADVIGEMLGQIMEQEEKINIGLGTLLSKGLRWGFCIPSSCTSEDLTVGLSEYLGNKPVVDVSVNNTDCHFDADKPFSYIDTAAIMIFIALMLIVLLSTGYEFLKEYMSTDENRNIKLNPCCSSASLNSVEGPLGTLAASGSGSQVLPQGVTHPSTVPQRTGVVVDFPCRSAGGTVSPKRQSLYRTQSQESWSKSSSGSTPDGGSRPSSPAKQQSMPRPVSLDLLAQSDPGTSHHSVQDLKSSSETNKILPSESETGLAPNGNISEILRVENGFPVMPHEDVTPTRELSDSEFDPWAAFSLLSNGRKLFSFEHPILTLQSLYGLKFLSICWVLIGHTCSITDSLPATNYAKTEHFTSQLSSMPLLNSSLAADTFLVITGVLISYNFLRDMKRRGVYRRKSDRLSRTGLTSSFFIRYLPLYYCHRYVRLTPALAAVVLFQVSLLDYLGSGPFWDSGNGYLAQVCRENWAGTLSYLQNYINADKICLAHSWYLMVDMQLYTVSPLILLFLLAWNKRRAVTTVCVLITVGTISTFAVNYWLELPPSLVTGDPSKWPLKNRFDHVATHTRFAPWMIGIGAGYILHCFRMRGEIQLKLSPLSVLFGWILTPLGFLYALLGVLAVQQHHYEHGAFSAALYSSLYHVIWSLGVGWIIIACESNHGGFIQSLLSWKLFQPLSRLAFCMYLVHMPLMTYQALMTRVPIYFNGINVISSILGDALLCVVLATVLSLFVELPFIRLFKYMTMKVGFPVRQTTPLNGSRFLPERVPLLRNLALASYQAIASSLSTYHQLPRAQRTADTAHLATINETHPQTTASADQQTKMFYGSSSSEVDAQSGASSSENSQQNGIGHGVTSEDVPLNLQNKQ